MVFYFIFHRDLKNFIAVLGLQQNREEGMEIFLLSPAPIFLLSLACISSPIINITHIFFLTKDEPTLMHHAAADAKSLQSCPTL